MTDLELFIEDTKERLDNEKAYNDFMQMCKEFNDMTLMSELSETLPF